MGREQLKRMPEIIAAPCRRLASRYYRTAERQSSGLVTRTSRIGRAAISRATAYELPDRLDQRAVMQAMLDALSATRRGIMCAYCEAQGCGGSPDTHLFAFGSAQDLSVSFRFYLQMNEEDSRTLW